MSLGRGLDRRPAKAGYRLRGLGRRNALAYFLGSDEIRVKRDESRCDTTYCHPESVTTSLVQYKIYASARTV